jgi:integrase
MTTTRHRRVGVEDRWSKTVRDEHGTTTTVPSAAHGQGLRWRARYVDDQGQEHAKGFGRRADAKRWLEQITAAQVVGSYVDPRAGKVTFASFYANWSARQVWTSGTRINMDLVTRSVPFADVALAELRVSHLESWVAAIAATFAPSTVKSRFANIRTVIRAAVADRHMARDVTERVRLPRTRKLSAAMTIPTTEQVGAVIRTAEPEFAALVAVCAFAGLRLGEASALRVADVDFLRRELHVRRQVQWPGGGHAEIRPPKYSSERTVYAPDGLLSLLAEHVRRFRPGGDPDRWLFPNGKDDTLPMHAGMVAYQWRIARERAGVGFRLHDLRHFYASGLIRAGCDVVTVQRALGHSSATTTLRTYSHLWPDANDRTRKAAGELLAASLNSPADALRTK